jgi:hypothetical protein
VDGRAHLLLNRVVVLDDHWGQEDLPERLRRTIRFEVPCHDIFTWSADDEPLP